MMQNRLLYWLRRTKPGTPALVLPGGETWSYADMAARPGCAGLHLLTGNASTLALGMIDCALGGGTAMLLSPNRPVEALATQIEQARAHPSLALILTTSGSTGEPKAVCLSWRAVAAAARFAHRNMDLHRGDAWLACMPLAFAGGAMILYRVWRAGATAIIHDGFSIDTIARDFAQRQITHISLTPAMLAQLVDATVPPPPTLRCALIGGAALSPSLAERARAAGWPLRLSYGMTETCATALIDGHPLPGVRVRIHSTGVLEIATPARMAGYLDGTGRHDWFTTSDLAAIDAEGCVNILGRADDMLISGGVNVHPIAVEARLSACPGLHESAVTGLPHPVWGDIIACIYEGDADASSVEHWCRAALPSTHRPRRFLRVPQLPRLASGKLDRQALPKLWS